MVPVLVSHLVYLILEGSALTNGGLNMHSSVKRKLDTEKDYVFDKRLRYSVRQNESNCRFRDIVVRKEEGFTHILLSSQTSDNNALTPEVRGQDQRGGSGWVGPRIHQIGVLASLCSFREPLMEVASVHTHLTAGHHLLITSVHFPFDLSD